MLKEELRPVGEKVPKPDCRPAEVLRPRAIIGKSQICIESKRAESLTCHYNNSGSPIVRAVFLIGCSCIHLNLHGDRWDCRLTIVQFHPKAELILSETILAAVQLIRLNLI